MDTFRPQPSLADSLQFGEQVVLVSESGGLYRAQQEAQNGHTWTFPPDSTAFSGSSFPADALLVVLKGQDPKYIGFRSTFADGKLLGASKGKEYKLPHFEGHAFGPAEQWAVVGKSFHRCQVSNRKFPDKRLSVMLQRIGSGQVGRSSTYVSVLDNSSGASQEFEDLSLSSPRSGADVPLEKQAEEGDKPQKGRPSALQYALGGLEYLKLGPTVADEGSPVFLSPVNTPPASPHEDTPQSKLRKLEVGEEGEGAAGEVGGEGGKTNGVVSRGRSGNLSGEGEGRRMSESVEKVRERGEGGGKCECVCMYVCIYVCLYVCLYVCMFVCLYVWMYVGADVARVGGWGLGVGQYVGKLEARVAHLQSQVMKYSQAAREAEEEVGRRVEEVGELEKQMNDLASRQVTAGLTAMKASEEAEMEVEKVGKKLGDVRLENAQLVAREKEAVRKLSEMVAEKEGSEGKWREKISAAKAEGQSEAAEGYKERVREIKEEVERHYANLLDVKLSKAREEIEKKASQEAEERVAAESKKVEVGVNKAVEKRTAAMRSELIAASSKQVKDRVSAARAEIESRVAKEVEQKVEVIRQANEASANAYAEERIAEMKKKLGEVMMEGDARVQKAKEEGRIEAETRIEEVERSGEEKLSEVGKKYEEKVAKLKAKLKGMSQGGGWREKGKMDEAEIKQAAFTLAEAKVARAKAEFLEKIEAAERKYDDIVEERVAKLRSDIEAKEAKKVAEKLTRLEKLCDELEKLKDREGESGESGKEKRNSETEWKTRLAQSQVDVANVKAEEASSAVRRLEVVNEALIKRLKDSKVKFAETIAGLEHKVKSLSDSDR